MTVDWEQARRIPVGAEAMSGGVHFRVWAPERKTVEVVFEGDGGTAPDPVKLSREAAGYFSGFSAGARAGSLYRYRLDGGDAFPDPASRFQPDGPHGPSRVVDPGVFRWTDDGWRGTGIRGQVLYEMHAGTFTRHGTWESAAFELRELAALGITVLEVMPVNDFAGQFGWGYDGVNLFAPTRLYGEPDDFRQFIDKAHSLGMAVILDVVYNHLGPDGNYLAQFSPHYFSRRYKTDWGEALNFDDEHCGPVREYFIANAGYWIDEFHLDGLRIDATQDVFDSTPGEHILAGITRRVREAARGRSTIVVAENEPQETKLVRPPSEGGYGMDALWNDDFHHTAFVALSGRNDAYYTDYKGTPQELISAVKWGYLYQGQWYKWQNKRRGTPTFGLQPAAFVNFIQNHDQIANSARGQRAHRLASPGCYRAMTALMLLAPGTPMLFQGQEFAASAPFLFFADHKPEIARVVRNGRAGFLAQWRSLKTVEMQASLPDPTLAATFSRCKLDHSQREKHSQIYQLHRDLLKLRREDPVFRAQTQRGVDGAVLSGDAFVLRYFGEDGDDRLLIVNLGLDLHLHPSPEPLLAPPEGTEWQTLWSSEDHIYGGWGTPPLDTEENWQIPGRAAIVLYPHPRGEQNA